MGIDKFVREVKDSESMYFIKTNLTNTTFVSCDNDDCDDLIYVFFLRNDAQNKVDELNKLAYSAFIEKIEKEKIVSSLGDLSNLGVNAINVKYKDGFSEILQLSDLIRMDADKLNEVTKVVNPLFNITSLYFLQEFRRMMSVKNSDNNTFDKAVIDEVNSEAFNAKLKEAEEEMLINVIRSTFLMPVMKSEGDKVGIITLNRGKDGNGFIPLFSDINEMEKFEKSEKTGISIVDFKKIQNIELPDKFEGFVINMYSTGVIITRDWVKSVKIV